MEAETVYRRKIIHMAAEDSPNVRRGLDQVARGEEPDGLVVMPGVLSWEDYCHRLATWDEVRICVGVRGLFWEGADLLMFPPDWLDRAEALARSLSGGRKAKAIGCDPAEGGDSTAMAAVDELGLIELVSKKTPDTSVITDELLMFMKKHDVPPERVCIDRGGGGKQHADRIRTDHKLSIRTIGFGEAIQPDIKHGLTPIAVRKDIKEEKYEYLTRRAQMYGEWREIMDPGPASNPRQTFAIPAAEHELRRQIAVLPLLFDGEGRMRMLPKHRPTGQTAEGKKEKTWSELIGRSPDEADAVALAVHAMRHRDRRAKVGGINFH